MKLLADGGIKMSNLIIETYFEKVDRTGCKDGEYGKVVRGEFELQRRTDMGPDSRTNKELKKHLKRFNDYSGEVSPGCLSKI